MNCWRRNAIIVLEIVLPKRFQIREVRVLPLA